MIAVSKHIYRALSTSGGIKVHMLHRSAIRQNIGAHML